MTNDKLQRQMETEIFTLESEKAKVMKDFYDMKYKLEKEKIDKISLNELHEQNEVIITKLEEKNRNLEEHLVRVKTDMSAAMNAIFKIKDPKIMEKLLRSVSFQEDY